MTFHLYCKLPYKFVYKKFGYILLFQLEGATYSTRPVRAMAVNRRGQQSVSHLNFENKAETLSMCLELFCSRNAILC